MSILKNIATKVGLTATQNSALGLSRRELIDKEAKIGRQLFGAIPRGHRREFFCLDDHTWIWYEEWTDINGQRQFLNTRYEIRPNGILKIQGDRHYVFISDEEAKNLLKAIRLYYQYVTAHVYNITPPAHAVA